MKKFYALAVVIIIIFGFIFLKPKHTNDTEFNENFKIDCDLNMGACEKAINGKIIKFEITPRPIYAMQPVVFKISGLDKLNLKNPSLKFYGLNMDMGDIKAKLKRDKDDYVSKIVLSACVIDVMIYRFKVLDDGRDIGIYIDFELKM